jgi:hypothetical protein
LGQEVCTHLLKSYLMEDDFWHARRKDRYVQLAVKGKAKGRNMALRNVRVRAMPLL